MRKGQRFVSSYSHITTKSGDTCLGCCAQTALVLWFLLKGFWRGRGILSHDSESGSCCWWDLCWSGLNCCDSDFEGFACSLPDVVPLSDKSIEATSHMCLGGVGKVFLCHWTLDQRGVKDCLCPFSIAAAWGWQRPEEAPASSPFSGAGFLSPVLLPRQTWAFPVLPYLVWDSLWLHSECNKPAWHFSVAKPENYPCFLMELLLFISTEIPLSSVCTGRSGKARLPPLIKSQIWSRS